MKQCFSKHAQYFMGLPAQLKNILTNDKCRTNISRKMEGEGCTRPMKARAHPNQFLQQIAYTRPGRPRSGAVSAKNATYWRRMFF